MKEERKRERGVSRASENDILRLLRGVKREDVPTLPIQCHVGLLAAGNGRRSYMTQEKNTVIPIRRRINTSGVLTLWFPLTDFPESLR